MPITLDCFYSTLLDDLTISLKFGLRETYGKDIPRKICTRGASRTTKSNVAYPQGNWRGYYNGLRYGFLFQPVFFAG